MFINIDNIWTRIPVPLCGLNASNYALLRVEYLEKLAT